jgi:hypothetical protein
MAIERNDFAWFKWQRLEWIDEISEIYGFINREHICKKFGVSIPQASLDLRDLQKLRPGMLEYDSSAKLYRRVQT